MTRDQREVTPLSVRLFDPFREAAVRDPALDPRTDTERVYAVKTIFRLRRERARRRHP